MKPSLIRYLSVIAIWLAVSRFSFAQATPDDKSLKKIAFGSCASQEYPQVVWDAINDTQPDLFIFLGDNIYADTTDMDVMRKCYDKLAAIPGFAKLRASNTRILATWD